MDCKQDIENINRKRKSEQVFMFMSVSLDVSLQAKAGGKLRELESKFVSAIQKTNELEGVCMLLERVSVVGGDTNGVVFFSSLYCRK